MDFYRDEARHCTTAITLRGYSNNQFLHREFKRHVVMRTRQERGNKKNTELATCNLRSDFTNGRVKNDMIIEIRQNWRIRHVQLVTSPVVGPTFRIRIVKESTTSNCDRNHLDNIPINKHNTTRCPNPALNVGIATLAAQTLKKR